MKEKSLSVSELENKIIVNYLEPLKSCEIFCDIG